MSPATAAPPVRRALTPPRTRPRPTTRNASPAPAPRRMAPPAARRPRLRGRWRMVLLVAVVAAAVITVAGFHAVLAQNQVRLEQLNARNAAAEARYDARRLENGELGSPERITARAAALGLVVPPVAPVPVALMGDVPRRGDASPTIDDWAEVKRHLDASP